jgi:hypothetical protein
MFDGELTIQDVLNDPLIRLMMHADGISSGQMRSLLYQARERHSMATYREMALPKRPPATAYKGRNARTAD